MKLRKITYFILPMLLFWVVVAAQKKIPFRLTDHNNLILKTIVNAKDSLDLMFQIAIEDAAISPDHIHGVNHVVFNQSNGGSAGNHLKIGDWEWDNVQFSNDQLSAKGSDGKIGTGIFKGKIFGIDYDHNQLLIYDTMPNLQDYKRIPVIYKNEVFNINVDNVIQGKNYEHLFFLQSGYAGGLLYDDTFSSENRLIEKLQISNEKILKDASGGQVITKQAILPEMILGGISLKNVTTGFFVGKNNVHDYSFFGADLIKRFNWIFDAERKTAYIKPSRYFSSPFFQVK